MSSVVQAFSADHVVRLTGLSKDQLRYWDETGFFRPRYVAGSRSPYSRMYSFKDVVGLRTLSLLRKDYQISLQHLRKVAQELSQYQDAPWSELKLYVLGNEVIFREPETSKLRSVVGKQYVTIPLRNIEEDVEAETRKLKERSKEQIGQIARHRYVVHNAWVVAGTRIPTKAIWRFSEAGYTPKQILKEYPSLKEADVVAAILHEERLAKQA